MNQTEQEDFQNSISQDLVNQSQKKIKELENELSRIHKQMRQENVDQVYKDNDILKKELKNMEILLDENDDLREEVDRLKSMSFDSRYKIVGDEN